MNATTAPTPKKRSMLPMLMISLVLSGVSGGAAWYFASHGKAAAAPAAAEGEHAEAAKPTLPIYYEVQPAFVVNLADGDADRYLQLDVQVMARDQKALDGFQLHEPLIRNRLLLLFGQNTSADLARRADKERLQREALDEVQAVLKAEKGAPIDALYFTSFVTQ